MANPIGLVLPIRNSNYGYFDVSTDILTQVKNNFINLIMTIKGERVNNPEFGCDIHKVIFEQNSNLIYEKSLLAIESAVEKWMPFLELEQFEILDTKYEIDRYILQIYVKYRLTNAPNITDAVVLQI